jgi:hypothetical protein
LSRIRLTRESGEWNWHVGLWPRSYLNLLRQGRFGVPRSHADGVNIMVRRARVKRVDERVATEVVNEGGWAKSKLPSVTLDWLGMVYSG